MLDKRGIKTGDPDGGIDVRTDGGAKHTCSDGTAADPIGDQGTAGNLGTQGMRAAGDGLIRTDASQACPSAISTRTRRDRSSCSKKRAGGSGFIPCPPRRTRYRPFSTGTEMVALVSLPCCQRTVPLSEIIEKENCA